MSVVATADGKFMRLVRDGDTLLAGNEVHRLLHTPALTSEAIASCTSRDAAWAAFHLLSGECERRWFNHRLLSGQC